MRYSEVVIKKTRALCDLLEASPSGPTVYEERAVARILVDCARGLMEASDPACPALVSAMRAIASDAAPSSLNSNQEI